MQTINDMVRDALRASEVIEESREKAASEEGARGSADPADDGDTPGDLEELESEIEKAAVELEGERPEVSTADEPAGDDLKPQGGDHPDVGPQTVQTPDPGPAPKDPEVSAGDEPAAKTPKKQPDDEDPETVGPDHVHKTADDGEEEADDDGEDDDGKAKEESPKKEATEGADDDSSKAKEAADSEDDGPGGADDEVAVQKVAEKVVEYLVTKGAIDGELGKVAGPGRGAMAAGAGLLGLLGGGVAGHAVSEADDMDEIEAAYMAGVDDLANALLAEQISGSYGSGFGGGFGDTAGGGAFGGGGFGFQAPSPGGPSGNPPGKTPARTPASKDK